MKKLSFTLAALLLIIVSSSGCGQISGSDLQRLKSSLTEKTLTILVGNNNGGSGNVSPDYGSHQYKSHQEVIVTATPSPGSLFVGWQGIDGILSKMSAVDPSKPSSGRDYKIDVVMKRDVTLTALFARAFNLTINVNGSGTVRIDKVQGMGDLDATMFAGDIAPNLAASHVYYGGEYVTFSILPSSASTFQGWTGDMTQVDPQYLPPSLPFTGAWVIPLDPLTTTVTVYMDHDVNLTANFGSK